MVTRGGKEVWLGMVTSLAALRGSYDVVVGGAGIIGCASAYFLAKRIPAERICLIERDPSVSALDDERSVRRWLKLDGAGMPERTVASFFLYG